MWYYVSYIIIEEYYLIQINTDYDDVVVVTG